MCWQKHLPVGLRPVPVSACGTSFHNIIQNMTAAAQVPPVVSAGRLTQCVCEEFRAETWVSIISLSFCWRSVWDAFLFLFFSRGSCSFQVSWKLGIIITFSWLYFPLTGPVGSERPFRQEWSPRERWWGWQRRGAWAAWFSRTAGDSAP